MRPDNSAHRGICIDKTPGGYGPSWRWLITEPLENLRLSGRRAVLALLGIAVGCMSVVALLNIGYNARLQAMSVFKGMGSDLLVSSIQPPQGVLITPPEPFTGSVALRHHQVTCCFFTMLPDHVSYPKGLQTPALPR